MDGWMDGTSLGQDRLPHVAAERAGAPRPAAQVQRVHNNGECRGDTPTRLRALVCTFAAHAPNANAVTTASASPIGSLVLTWSPNQQHVCARRWLPWCAGLHQGHRQWSVCRRVSHDRTRPLLLLRTPVCVGVSTAVHCVWQRRVAGYRRVYRCLVASRQHAPRVRKSGGRRATITQPSTLPEPPFLGGPFAGRWVGVCSQARGRRRLSCAATRTR